MGGPRPYLVVMALLLAGACTRVSNNRVPGADSALHDGAADTTADLSADTIEVLQVSPLPTDSFCPKLARIGDDVLIVWIQELANGELELYSRRLDATGRPVSAALRIAEITAGDPDCPTVVPVDAHFELFWRDGSQVFHASVARDGGLARPAHDRRISSQFAVATDGQKLALFYREPDDDRLYFRYYDTALAPLDAAVLVDVPDPGVSRPRIAFCSGDWIVSWSRTEFSGAATWGLARLDAQGRIVEGPVVAFPEKSAALAPHCDGAKLVLSYAARIGSRNRHLQLAVRDRSTLDLQMGPVDAWTNRDESMTNELYLAGGRVMVVFEAEVSSGPVLVGAFSFSPVIGLGFNDGGLGAPGDAGSGLPYADSGVPLGMDIEMLEGGKEPTLVGWDDGRALIAYRRDRNAEGFVQVVVRQHTFF